MESIQLVEERIFATALVRQTEMLGLCFSADGRLFHLQERDREERPRGIWELDPATGQGLELLQTPLLAADKWAGWNWVQTSRNGILAGVSTNKGDRPHIRMIELNAGGAEVWRADIGDPVDCERLRNGNTLVTCDDFSGYRYSKNRCVELDRCGRPVWETYTGGGLFKARSVYSLLRFGFSRPENGEMSIDAAFNRIRSLKSSDPLMRYCSAERLAELPATRTTGEAALGLLRDSNPEVRKNMVRAAVAAKKYLPHLVERLVQMLADENAHVHGQSREALASIGTDAVPTLLAVVKNRNVKNRVREAALCLLARLIPCENSELEPLVRQHLNRGTPEERQEILYSLNGNAENLIPDVLRALREENRGVRCGAVRALGGFGKFGDKKKVVPGLLEALHDKRCRSEAASALSEMCQDDEEIANHLIACLQERLTAGERAAIILAIGQVGTKAKRALPALVEALEDSRIPIENTRNCSPRMAAVFALPQMGPEARVAIERLVQLGNDESVNCEDRTYIRRAVETIHPESAKRITLRNQ